MIADAAVMTALLTGLLGSAHCAAMCGPLALAGCSREGSLSPRDTAGYLAGRAIAYTALGAVLGHLGRHALCILPMAALEGVAVATVGLAALVRGVKLLAGRGPAQPLLALGIGPRRGGLLRLAAEMWPRRGTALGLATGVMPCGLLLPAWALAAGTASAVAGAAVMAVFSAATLPGLAVPLVGRRAVQRALAHLPRSAPGFAWIALAAWTALRPLLVARGACHF